MNNKNNTQANGEDKKLSLSKIIFSGITIFVLVVTTIFNAGSTFGVINNKTEQVVVNTEKIVALEKHQALCEEKIKDLEVARDESTQILIRDSKILIRMEHNLLRLLEKHKMRYEDFQGTR